MIGIIYKLTDNSDKVYYGSTIKPLKKRLCYHKRPSNICMSRIMDRDSMKIECLEQYYFDTDMDHKSLIKKRESYYIRNNECVNKNIPGRTMSECKKAYREKNKERLKVYAKEYLKNNKEQIYLKQKENYQKEPIIECECGGKYRTKHKTARHNKTKKHIAFLNK
tara:strand:+ start:51 stop:545 length:495 start_codon:yes stop_codon:yes gene_type:complete